jgi:glycosyltransferase involved in cell wall biosynthesis
VGELQAAGVEVLKVIHPARSFRLERKDFRAICAVKKPDIVHTHGYLPDVLSASFGKRMPFGRITTVHGFTGGTLRNRTYEWMQRRAYSRLDAVVAVSVKLGEQIVAAGGLDGRVHAIANAWSASAAPVSAESARASLGLPLERFTVGWVGRISHEKGLDVFIDSLPLLKDLAINAVVIGSGPERALIEKRADYLGVAERITWMGQRLDAAEVLPAFDLIVISSRTEGTPMILFEAMHAGVPIIASAVGGIPSVVSADEAVLVKSEDPSTLAIAIRTAHNSASGRMQRAARARERLQKDFATEPWIELYDRLYRDIMSRVRSR